MKIAGAPISWGVCEVPGWGYQLDRDRVLTEMRGAGLTATELGPDGFLPTDTDELKAVLREHDLACVGGFVPVVLFKADHDPADDLAGPLESLVAAGAGVVVLAAATGCRRLRLASGARRRPVGHAARQPGPAGGDRRRRADCSRCCTRTSARSSRPATTSTACWRVRRSRCAWTPATC